MYPFSVHIKISQINEEVNTIFISPETLTSYFDVTLNERNAGQRTVFHVWLFNVSSCQKMVSKT